MAIFLVFSEKLEKSKKVKKLIFEATSVVFVAFMMLVGYISDPSPKSTHHEILKKSREWGVRLLSRKIGLFEI